VLGIAMAMTIEKSVENEVETTSQRIEIAEVMEGSGAEKAGLAAGDEIIAINNIKVDAPGEIVEIIGKFTAGEAVPVTVKRNDQEITVNVILSEANPSEMNKKQTIVIEKEIKTGESMKSFPGNEELQLEELKIHPNPANDVINISLKGEKGPLSISITDMEGKNILRKEIDDFDGTYQDEIDLHDFPKGTVILQVEQHGKKHTEKVVRM
jgi:membrane-associated protease RseP (regulator of RpoE activity)